ncbi:PEP-CTERM sorting domain-containing protein [Methylotenera sp.]|jgi:hypothetical protein|uniref:Npun_F0296 family exosortase-dependent surface protein n=1 Tax=Methylotenera sp. TaxID=2051956 RepID=UPI002718DDEA|nr:PEP-CTERM sorting domain-containing protein [Methylotenera sp.]MDO9205543.1 PEP-CTERM sorting domain-containing protein [Methylotenera sp.]MDP2071641.1 PEP-CTERM sorting domain-containing protein [Methylotenera sp.]MDP2231032.1 PEP-CTERM sorting domain-containing protein [Methylotenera sp.]MDP3006731.1 PEP-CTERM sorting domain-containing protein [Methylotenera sp.]MDP3308407.1 PEP-CTERM sorting domain-containing protein [Methylotenera sp.]
MNKFSKLSTALAVMALFAASSASAALTVTIGGDGNPSGTYGEKSIFLGAVTTDFNASLINPTGYTGGGVVNGTNNGFYASPPSDNTNYFSVGPSTSTPGVVAFAGLSSYFGYYGGSPDAFNSVEFYNGASLVQSFNGVTLAGIASVAANGDRSVGSFWNFAANSPVDFFDSVRFISTRNAFETDNHAVLTVPEPETYAMMLAGLGLMGFVARRRKNG